MGRTALPAAQATYSFNVTKVDSLVANFFPLGTAIVNVPVTLAGQIVLANNGCAPYGGTVAITDYASARQSCSVCACKSAILRFV